MTFPIASPTSLRRPKPASILAFALLVLPSLASAETARAPLAEAAGARFDGAIVARAVAGSPMTARRPTDGAPRGSLVSAFDRTDLGDGIAHYRFELAVGAGEHERIRLHRVVRELAPFVPRPSGDAVMLAHGDVFPFVATFLTSTLLPEVDDTVNLAAFLAAGGVDVWGLDFRWALVPADTEDLSFMSDWGIATDAGDLDLALAAARLLRLLGGSGAGRLHLAGYSRGGHTAYAYLSAESQRPSFLRQARGFIPIDIMAKTDDEDLRQRACANAADAQARVDAGAIASSGANIAFFAQLALDAPDDPSPILPFLTNAGLMRLIGADIDPDLSPTFHRTGGTIDDATLETELTFSADRLWFAWNAGIVAFEPWRVVLDGETLRCDQADSPFDDHFADITVPVLYVGAAGGFGDAGVFNLSLLGSADTGALVVRELAVGAEAQDYGHVDLLIGDDADTLVWQAMLDWIRAH